MIVAAPAPADASRPAAARGAEAATATGWGASLHAAPRLAAAGSRAFTWAVALAVAAALGAAAVPNGCQGRAMGKMVIFSEVRGRVLQDGKAVAGATVDREFRWVWKDETGRDSTTTGPAGEFTLPRIERSSFLGGLLPHEPVVRQSLTIRHGGKTYEAWLLDKRNYDDNGELEGKPLRLVCRLEAAPGRHAGGYYGICDVE